jgi:hypothetical protein
MKSKSFLKTTVLAMLAQGQVVAFALGGQDSTPPAQPAPSVDQAPANQQAPSEPQAKEKKPGAFGFKLGGDKKTPVTGSAGPSGSSGASSALETCEKPFGTLTVAENPDQTMKVFQQMSGLPEPSPLLRLIIQQSRCFQIVERGVAFQNMMQERELSKDGQLKSAANVGRGQMVAVDFLLTPNVVVGANTGGAALLGGALFGALGAAAFTTKNAQTTLFLTDARSGIQIAGAEGNVKKTDLALGAILGSGGLGGYGSTSEGKLIAAAFLDNYNKIVLAIKNEPSLIASKAVEASSQNAVNSTEANAFNAGDTLKGKIAGVKALSDAKVGAKVLFALTKDEEVVYLGEEKNGFLKVQGANGEGWVDRRLMK